MEKLICQKGKLLAASNEEDKYEFWAEVIVECIYVRWFHINIKAFHQCFIPIKHTAIILQDISALDEYVVYCINQSFSLEAFI